MLYQIIPKQNIFIVLSSKLILNIVIDDIQFSTSSNQAQYAIAMLWVVEAQHM